jgi:CheY-like chemotaxis protein
MPQTVLICDDNDQVRRLIAVVLGSQGYDLREATNGQATLEEIASSPPDLVILDMHMPGIDGIAVLGCIRSDPALASVQVLLLSGDTAALDDHWSEQLGADAHLPKPFAASALTETVQSLLMVDS